MVAIAGSVSAQNMPAGSQGMNLDGSLHQVPGTSTPFYGQQQEGSARSSKGMGQAVNTNALPAVVSDENVYRLTDLVNSDFRMPVTDKDFELTHE